VQTDASICPHNNATVSIADTSAALTWDARSGTVAGVEGGVACWSQVSVGASLRSAASAGTTSLLT
jgi:hypothetical protein